MPKATETLLEIDLNALRHNYNYLSSKVDKNTKMLAVVKAFGYGSESVAIANELATLGVAYFGVAYAGEGETLRNAGIETPILVLHPLPVNFDLIVNRCMEPSVYSHKILKDFINYAESQKQHNYPIHLKFNTGLNRLGFRKEDIPKIIETLSRTESVSVKSVFSHLAASEDEAERNFTIAQIDEFRNISEAIIRQLGYKPLLHTVNTSGILNYPEAQFDMVRTGIGLYGFGNNPSENINLKPVATLKTVISQIHTIKEGENVGYNMGFKARETTRTATLPIGHADGISRAFGKGVGWVLINGAKAPIVGNVCMDMIMVDITHISCEEGDEAIVFGETSTAETLSEAINSIPYELLTAISQRVKRVVCRK
ncbi:alanine racemase [Ulvibacter sp. MAR_2010_11]|uniref:alanine racemase n=1 Tax=Ulvibacter sp. MAR_2010_11 TaxID=1250229 RepID=UPI000C2BED0E|nr:alanine racemase [Ulvibacter sp. MAR_2010_11]PKA82985.1 alanine racemase [Ulvibacter sp. MAR_2010_11]